MRPMTEGQDARTPGATSESRGPRGEVTPSCHCWGKQFPVSPVPSVYRINFLTYFSGSRLTQVRPQRLVSTPYSLHTPPSSLFTFFFFFYLQTLVFSEKVQSRPTGPKLTKGNESLHGSGPGVGLPACPRPSLASETDKQPPPTPAQPSHTLQCSWQELDGIR